MTRRDRGFIAVLLTVLIASSMVVLLPTDAGLPTASETPAPTTVAARPYREGFVGQPTSVSPFGATTAADRALVALTFSGLVRLGTDGDPVPDLAASWTIDPAGRSYTFQLRPDATWQDGQPVTAHDVEFTIGALKDPAYTGPGGASWRDVSVTVLGPRTVRLDLGDPIAGFLYAATQPIAPAHLLEGTPAADLATDAFGQAPVGSGPYRLVSWNAGAASLELASPRPAAEVSVPSPTPTVDSLATVVPSSGPSAPGLARIEFRFSEDPGVLATAYRAGELDAVSGLPPQLEAQLGDEAGSQLLRYPRSTLTAVVFDLRPGNAAFRDARVRRGLLEAVDRDGIVAGPMAGLAVRADAPIPPSFAAYDQTVSRPVAQDRAGAAKDLATGGWRHTAAGWIRPGQKTATPLRLLCPEAASNPVGCAVANAVAADWRTVGLTVDVIPLPPSELVAKHLRTGEFDAAVLDIAIGLDPDLYPLLASSQTISGGSNVSGLQDPQLDQKLAAARRPASDAVRLAAWRDLQAYLATSTFMLPIAFRDEVVVARDTLSGPIVRPIGDGSDRFYDVLTWRLADDR